MPLPASVLGAISQLEAINAIGSARLISVVKRLTEREGQDLGEAISAVDARAGGYRVFGTSLSYWAGPARAWMLHQLPDEKALTFNPPTFSPLEPPVLAKLVDKVAAMSAQDVLDELATALSGKRHIAALAGAQNDPVRKAAMDTWNPDLFTMPAAHKPDKFVHLIVGLRRNTDIGLASAPKARKDYVAIHLSDFIDKSSGTYRSAEHYLSNPDILTKSLISTSVITETKSKTYANMHFGFVLRAPKELIAAASHADMDMGFDKATRPDMLAVESDRNVKMALITDSFVQGVASLYMRPLPKRIDLINQTSETGHNEVAVIGSIGGFSVRVSGIFVKVSPGKPMLAAEHDTDDEWEISKKIIACADRLGVPVVMIPDKNIVAGKTWFATRYGGL